MIDRLIYPAALAGSLLMTAVGVLWWLAPGSYPFGPDDRYADLALMTYVPRGAAIAVAVILGIAGMVLAAGRRDGPVAIAFAAVAATVLGLLVPDIQVLILAAYAMALAVPSALVAVLANRLLPRLPVAAVFAVAFAAVLGWLSYVARDADPIGARPLFVFGSFAAGAVWAAVLIRLLRAAGGDRPAWTQPEAAARWGRTLTWAAALCPLPYVLTRLSWLTPWPIGESAETLAAHPGLRIFGLALALAGEGGTWLTLGLIRPRGETFPAWLPVVGRRPVPVLAAVIPGLLAAAAITIAGHSILQQAVITGDYLLVLLMPFPLWGPLLAAATFGYWLRRRPSPIPSRPQVSV
ncbi:hypothetical protein Ais01nite_03160 [Asanoa ishikariensis]|uniref:Uncharacterized protein n=1 Tax=Asanoa ishikariensis TaxID=137265 RepID=A0A1H3TJX5_9ACTN|nr:hypothetical protein [Asanoa ishikariensis]GIF62281.1 hypothetical protein Ais01nite_03160 [Asanoa ishikariensis]SDZ50544.1 hypothetical protein SAMN05421684_5915 [Asanoa ishikariensis]